MNIPAIEHQEPDEALFVTVPFPYEIMETRILAGSEKEYSLNLDRDVILIAQDEFLRLEVPWRERLLHWRWARWWAFRWNPITLARKIRHLWPSHKLERNPQVPPPGYAFYLDNRYYVRQSDYVRLKLAVERKRG